MTYKCSAFVRLSRPLPDSLVADTGRDPVRLFPDTSSHFKFWRYPMVAGNDPVKRFWDNPLNWNSTSYEKKECHEWYFRYSRLYSQILQRCNASNLFWNCSHEVTKKYIADRIIAEQCVRYPSYWSLLILIHCQYLQSG